MIVRKFVFAVVLLVSVSHRVKAADEAQRLEFVKKLYEQQKWEEVLREAGFANVFNLEGGIAKWSDEIDSDVAKY